MAKYDAETHARNVRAAVAARTITDHGHLYNDHTCTCRTCAERLAAARFFVAVVATDDDAAALADRLLAAARAEGSKVEDEIVRLRRELAEAKQDRDHWREMAMRSQFQRPFFGSPAMDGTCFVCGGKHGGLACPRAVPTAAAPQDS